MSDRVRFSLMALAAAAMTALALVWPQGLGARSPGPFGSEPVRARAPARPSGPAAPPVLSMAPGAAPARSPAQ